MIDCTKFKGQKLAVLGLGKSGLSAVKALQVSGVDVVCWDDNNKTHTSGLPLIDLNSYDMSDLDCLVLSPGIPHTLPEPHPITLRAKQANKQLVNDVHLFKESYEHDIVAVTGTNGKSTTTSLINHVLSGSQIGGNIGTPLMDLDNDVEVTVAELSSYQTEITDNLGARGVVWLNITPDHIDRHGDMDGYVQAKSKIFETDKESGTAVVCIDDKYSADIYEVVKQSGQWQTVPVSTQKKLDDGISIIEGQIFDHGELVGSMKAAQRLRGEHNHQNAACAYAIARTIYEMSSEEVISRFESFQGLAHRQYHVRTIGQVVYINDSKATNAEATEKALKSYENVYWLAGGVAKDGGIKALASCLSRIKKTYLYGKCAQEFATFLGSVNHPYEIFDGLEEATQKAHEEAQNNDSSATVLLSPACASFDQYPNFEKRGENFESVVESFHK